METNIVAFFINQFVKSKNWYPTYGLHLVEAGSGDKDAKMTINYYY